MPTVLLYTQAHFPLACALPQLLTGPGGGAVISEYEELLDALLKRTVDAEVGWGAVERP